MTTRQKNAVSGVLALGFTLVTGCSTYLAPPDQSMSEAEAVMRINTILNQSHLISSTRANSTCFIDPVHERGVRRDYSEIESVEVQKNCAGIILFGLLDPTGFSSVLLKYKDTTVGEIGRFPPFGTIWTWPPFYLFRPAWYEVDSAAAGFEFMRAKSAKSSGVTGQK